MTHRTYEPAWLTEATFELNELIRQVETGGDDPRFRPDPLGIYRPIVADDNEESSEQES